MALVKSTADILAEINGTRRGRPATTVRATCGKSSGYQAHYSAGERPCPACCAVHSAYTAARKAARANPDGEPMLTQPVDLTHLPTNGAVAAYPDDPRPTSPAAPGPDMDPTTGPTVEQLLDTAATSRVQRTRVAAGRIRTQIDELRTRVAEEGRTRDAEDAVADLRRRLDQAEKALRRLKTGGARPPRETPALPAVDNKAVRAWARAQNPPVPCPDVGRVPGTVVAAWREATS